jgi:hypothetical protein
LNSDVDVSSSVSYGLIRFPVLRTFSFIFLANLLSAAAKNVEVFPPLLRRIATNQAGKNLTP